MAGKNAAKQFMNTSFDASKSANTINYVNSAYMSAIPNAASGVSASGTAVPNGSKLSKVGLKHGGVGNSRQAANMHALHGNNYTDATAQFLGHN